MCIQLVVFGQTVIPAQTITSDAGEFSALGPVTDLGLNIDAATTSATTFPYAPGTQFADDIGYVSASGTASGTLTFTFASPNSISEIMIWNSYFDFELDHSIQTAQLVFKNDMGATITTENISAPIATAVDLLPYVTTFTEVVGVKEIDIVVTALWGGNEISLRRIAFAGDECTPSSVDASVTQTNATLMANASGLAYQWIDCDNNFDAIQGETGQNFTASVNGNYAVIVDNGCVDTSACMVVDMIGIKEIQESFVTIFPNPATNSVTIPISGVTGAHMLDMTGRMVETNLTEMGETSQLTWNHIESGVYLIKVLTENGEFSSRVQVVSAL